MRHTVFLLLGKDLLDIAPVLKQYTLMYGEGDAPDYLQVLTCVQNTLDDKIYLKGYAHVKNEEKSVFTSGLENRFQLGIEYAEDLKNDAELQQYFVNLFNRTVTIEDPGSDGSLDICLFLPLYNLKLWTLAQRIFKIIGSTGKQIRVDVLGLPSEMSFLISSQEEKEEIPEKLQSYKTTCAKVGNELVANEFIHRFILFEDTNSAGLALNLDRDRFVRILGEFALLYVEHYHVIFPNNQMGKKIDVTTFGLSLMAFDKIYFVHYLLRKAYLYIFHREKVNEEDKVNINHAADVAQDMLVKHVNLYKDFVKDKVEPTIAKRQNCEVLLNDTQKLETELNQEIEGAINDLQTFIKDPSLSLPEKQAIMAQLLGEDDPLVDGIQYFKEQLILDDYDSETLNYLISEDNKCVVVTEATETTPQKVEHGVLKAPLEKDTNKVYLPLNDIKLLRAKIRQRTTYIRKKTEELESIDLQTKDSEIVKKHLSDNSYHIGDEVFKLLPSDKETRLFKETYTPSGICDQNVDLRKCFTDIKKQGSLGSCSAFALVSIFEYILKKTDPSEPDLSERFAYYNALHKNHETVSDEGSSFFEIIETLSEEGLSTEALCPYAQGLTAPSTEAYADGKTRLVKVAKNVDVNHHAITSALSEGYPVAISLKIFESFATDKTGFIYRPTDEEISSENSGNHAMVLCGYSEDEKVYIVRNSWGTTFGDCGYCYIPFSYIDDPALNNQACIITDIDVAKQIRVAGGEKKTVSFNLTDDNIRHAILKILIDEENLALKSDSQKYAKLRYDYEKLLQVLANPSKRDEIYENSVKALDKNIESEKTKYQEYVSQIRPARLKDFSRLTNTLLLYDLGAIAFLVILLIMCVYFGWSDALFIDSVILGALIIFSILFFWQRNHKKSILKKELDEEAARINSNISRLNKEKTEKHIRMHLAGDVVSTLTDIKLKLVNRYNGIVSYNHGLKQWANEERYKLDNMVLPNKTPSIPLLDNSVLDEYFESRKESITKDICLYELIGNKSMTEQDLLNFKFNLRDTLINKLEKEYDEFSMIDYVTKKAKFPYLNNQENVLKEIMPTMDLRSTIFLNINQNGEIHEDSLEKHLFLHSDKQTDRNTWRDLYEMYFSQQPSDNELDSKYKLIELQVQNLSADQVAMLN